MNDIIKIQKSPLRSFCILPGMKFIYDFISILFFNIKNSIKTILRVNKRVNSSNSNICRKNLFLTLAKMGTGYTRNLLRNVFTGAWYKYQLSKYSLGEQKINWNNKYVYFPLHLQPELTTSALGDVYENQLYALECLRKILPDDWKIYVKENPNQYRLTTYPLYWRKQSFFLKRIQKMHNVVLISDDVDTNKLICNSVFVATITGTAGWEALVSGKQALVFGHAWYGMFPGCTRYNSSTTLDEILSNKADKDKLQQSVDFFADRLGTGTTSIVTLSTIENFDKEQNAKTVADAIEKYIDYYFPENEPEQIDELTALSKEI
jgi:hypothetical protein